jgi:hypothetical protein
MCKLHFVGKIVYDGTKNVTAPTINKHRFVNTKIGLLPNLSAIDENKRAPMHCPAAINVCANSANPARVQTKFH